MATQESSNPERDHEDDVVLASGRLEALGFMLQQAAAGPHQWEPHHLHAIGSMICDYSVMLNKAFYAVFEKGEAVNV